MATIDGLYKFVSALSDGIIADPLRLTVQPQYVHDRRQTERQLVP